MTDYYRGFMATDVVHRNVINILILLQRSLGKKRRKKKDINIYATPHASDLTRAPVFTGGHIFILPFIRS